MKDKVIIVTGASQGLGKAISLRLSQLGARLALVSRNEGMLKSLVEEIKSTGRQAEFYLCDVTDNTAVEQTVMKVHDTFGRIDMIINNAGVWVSDDMEDSNPDWIEEVVKTNTLGPIYFSKSVLKVMEKQASGSLVFINSIAGLSYPENSKWPVYAASKWGLTGYSKALSSKYKNTSVKVMSIHPGPIATDIDKNSGDDWGEKGDSYMTAADAAEIIVNAISSPGSIQIDTLEFKKTNWDE